MLSSRKTIQIRLGKIVKTNRKAAFFCKLCNKLSGLRKETLPQGRRECSDLPRVLFPPLDVVVQYHHRPDRRGRNSAPDRTHHHQQCEHYEIRIRSCFSALRAVGQLQKITRQLAGDLRLWGNQTRCGENREEIRDSCPPAGRWQHKSAREWSGPLRLPWYSCRSGQNPRLRFDRCL